MSMFCYQCQEAAAGKGCTVKGVCGKEPQTASSMDSLLYIVRGIAIANNELRKKGNADNKASRFILDALFCTITNANFDIAAIEERI
ncbi:MAG: hydroxylamine reductase, partial [Bacteroidales bacterium]|nr:hydroxylamine reductase [Bacteroidales bacterium]